MSTDEHRGIRLRDARDRLAEHLVLGEPFPLRDLPVPVGGLTVPYGQPARIPVELSQRGVAYELHDNHGRQVDRDNDGAAEPIVEDGTGQTLQLITPAIAEDVTYRIRARKTSSDRHAYLHEHATVKVGLDTGLQAWIRSHPALDPIVDTPAPEDSRLADYGDPIEVEIALSQEGVDYRLVSDVDGAGSDDTETVLSVGDVRGTAGNIVLQSRPMVEDIDLRVRATKTFEASERREDESQLLDARLSLKVKANPELKVGLSPGPVLAFSADAAVQIRNTQPNAQYRVYLRRITDPGDDPDYIHNPAPDDEVVRVTARGESEVQVRRPALPDPWSPVAEFDAHGDYSDGNGDTLPIPVRYPADDCMLIVEARKQHLVARRDRTERRDRSIPSSVWLLQPAVLLRRPDPDQALSLSLTSQGARPGGLMRVTGGQPGIYYHFRSGEDGPKMPWPAYFHRHDVEDAGINRGIGQLEIEIDLAVAADPAPGPVDPVLDPSLRPPEPPLLETGPLEAGTLLHVRAVKAQTGVQAAIERTARVVGLPTIRPDPPAVAQGDAARIVIAASRAGEHYQLARDDTGIGAAVPGTGDDLEFETGPIRADTLFHIWITRPEDSGIPMRQSVPVAIVTLPDATLAVSASASEVDSGEAATLSVGASQVSVFYKLVVAGNPVGQAKAGTGGTLELNTGPIDSDSTFTVRATSAANRAVIVDLDQKVTVTVRPAV